jgi:hypothetical protein
VSVVVGLLGRVTWECVHFAKPHEAEQARGQLGDGIFVAYLTLGPSEPLLSGLARVLRFPDYFGHNWNALDECLADLAEWLPASAYVLFVNHASELLARDAAGVGSLIESWLAAAEGWGTRGIPFHLVFVW